jgi:hypothetical protein
MERRYTDNAQAYEAYLMGKPLVSAETSVPAMEAARKHFEAALKLCAYVAGPFRRSNEGVRKGRVYIAHSRQKAILGYPL